MTTLALLAALIWLGLLCAHGRFWQSGPELAAALPPAAPAVAVVIPARDEAETIGAVLASLRGQDYPGDLRIIVVDDRSTDATAAIAAGLDDPRIRVLHGSETPPGWSGKLWAVAQGIAAAREAAPAPEFLLLCDADIVHAPGHLSTLVAAAERGDTDLVSEMVALHCESLAERALVPAFVYFFQLLYPFAKVCDPLSAKAAAAAGGTMLLRPRALDRIGGIAAVRGALIDDVALAGAVKRGGRIWLGHTRAARSLRRYPDFADLWRMIARTAYVQLRFSPLLLGGTVLGMALVWLLGPALALFGGGAARLLGLLIWAMMAASYLPTLARFGRFPAWALAMPAIAAFYMAATIGSALDHHRGRGVLWKGRAYRGGGA
ncbi:MAG: glycosyltransferase [Rhodospirillales bacterium]|nr:glycosyltransferase [Rhodospirillales bacterium]